MMVRIMMIISADHDKDSGDDNDNKANDVC